MVAPFLRQAEHVGQHAENEGLRDIAHGIDRLAFMRAQLVDDWSILDNVAELERDVTELRAALIRAARDAGATWREIGEAFGVSAQRAHEMAPPITKQETPQ
jgi:hypothetical protein